MPGIITPGRGRYKEEFRVNFDIAGILEGDMANLGIFLPSHRRIVLVSQGRRLAGIACLKKLKDGISEIKSMYVRADFWRQVYVALAWAPISDAS